MIGLTGQLGDGAMLGWRDDALVDLILIRIERGPLLIHSGNLFPQGDRTLATAVADVEGNDLVDGGVYGNPDPLPVCFVPHKAPELVYIGLRPM